MKIVLTGGPSAGKTTIAETLAKAYWNRLALVPEGASVLFRGGFPRESNPQSVICQQRAIYHVQRELEEVSKIENAGKSLICDRGTLDGFAYWPASEAEFFSQMKTSMPDELGRYDWVIHLDTASESSYKSSLMRIESFEQAQKINEKVKWAWSQHPNWILLKTNDDFTVKITLALKVVKMILSGETLEKVKKLTLGT